MTPAEAAVLSALLWSNGDALHEVPLSGKDFSTRPGETLFGIIAALVDEGTPADVVTVLNRLARADPADRRGLEDHVVWDIAGTYTTGASIGYHAGVVAEESARRRLTLIATGLHQGATQGHDVERVATEAAEALARVGTSSGARLQGIAETMDDTLESLDQPVTYTETPWPSLNRMVHGWRPGGMYAIGARPSVGKTVLGFQAALSLVNRGPVAYTSLEMGVDELQKRMIAQTARVDLGRIERRQMTDADWEKVVRARETWQGLPLFVDPSNDATIAQVVRHAWAVKRRHGLAGVVVDYLGLLQGQPHQSEYQTVTEASRTLKLLARSLQVPVIALSQLNRGPESRDGKAPRMSDLRNSGAIEQDADVVILLHRDLQESPHEVEVIVAKNRQGIPGSVTLDFAGHYAEIRDPGRGQTGDTWGGY